jgi:hypothetical protein
VATISVTVPDAQLTRVVDAVCAAYGWTAADGPKPAFVRAQLAAHVKGIVRGVERAAAEQAAVAAVNVVDVPVT